MKKGILLLFIISCIRLYGQVNLAPNPSFELFDSCSNYTFENCHNWLNPSSHTFASPDYYNGCVHAFTPPSTPTPHNGNAYIGFYTYQGGGE